MLPIPQLPAMRARNNSLMASPATVSRAGVPLSLTMPDGTPLRCRITRDTKESRIEGASRLEEQTRWRISFQDGLDIRAGDQVTALGCIYGIVEVRNPSSYSVATDVVAFMLYDANSVPVYLRPNATVSTNRGGLPKLAAVPAERSEPSVVFTPEGQVIATKYTFYGTPLWSDPPGTLDLNQGDMLSEAGISTGVIKLVTPYTRGFIKTEVLVERG